MLTIRNYVKAQSLKEAYELNQKRANRVLGGMMWMKMSSGSVATAIDLSGLGLDTITENDEEFSIGCMVTLRQLELHPGLNAYTGGAMKESLRSIVGVQFRNTATVGGSIFGRFGFSDVLTLFLALDTQVELYAGGRISLEEFSRQKRNRDILVRLVVKKSPLRCAYLSHRNTKTDFPVLTCAVSLRPEGSYAVIGARPQAAILLRDEEGLLSSLTEEHRRAFADYVKVHTPTGSNLRAGSEYRSHLAGVLTYRALTQLAEEKGGTPSCF